MRKIAAVRIVATLSGLVALLCAAGAPHITF